MTMSLVSVDTKVHFYFNIWAWRNVLSLAKQYGWEPLGTEKPRLEGEIEEYWRDKDWNGDYLSNDFQIVKAEDAKSIAKALEIALVDMCNPGGSEKRKINDVIANDPLIKALREGLGGEKSDLEERYNALASTSPIDYFRDGRKETLTDFIDFCRKGAFVIC